MGTTSSVIMRIWKKVPLFFRAIILGLVISMVGIFIWTLVASFVPMPWGFLLMIVLLFFYINYFSGSWKPETTRIFRKNNFRDTILSSRTWLLSSLAIILIILIEQSSLVVTFRFMEFPADKFIQEYSFLNNVPVWSAWLVIILISSVAGICEEIGFRGYMQKPLEEKYRPLMAISTVSLVFVLVHLHQAWSTPLLIHIFFISVLFGLIAYHSKSLIPGIIAHILMDICNFSFWWSNLGYQFKRKTIAETGIDNHLILWSCIFVFSIAFFIYIISRFKINDEVVQS